MPHIHAGVIEGLAIAATMIIVLTAWHVASSHLSDKPIGQAMAFIM